MRVQNIECQLVQAQIGRYLNGDRLPQEILAEMEAHVNACSACATNLQERRSSLQALLSKPTTAPEPAPKAVSPRTGLLDLLKATSPKAQAEMPVTHAAVEVPAVEHTEATLERPTAGLWKPLALSGALAVVLIVMSTLAQNPSILFGPRAATKLPATSGSAPAAVTSPEVAYASDLDVFPASVRWIVEDYLPTPANQALTARLSAQLAAEGQSPALLSHPAPAVRPSLNPPVRATVRRPAAPRRTVRAAAPRTQIRRTAAAKPRTAAAKPKPRIAKRPTNSVRPSKPKAQTREPLIKIYDPQ